MGGSKGPIRRRPCTCRTWNDLEVRCGSAPSRPPAVAAAYVLVYKGRSGPGREEGASRDPEEGPSGSSLGRRIEAHLGRSNGAISPRHGRVNACLGGGPLLTSPRGPGSDTRNPARLSPRAGEIKPRAAMAPAGMRRRDFCGRDRSMRIGGRGGREPACSKILRLTRPGAPSACL